MPPSKPDRRQGAKDPRWGDYAFSPDRRDSVPYEENTPDEDVAWMGLKRHVIDNVPMGMDAAEQIRHALEDDAYPAIVHEPVGVDRLYRGMVLSGDILGEILGREDFPPYGVETLDRFVKIARDDSSSSWTSIPDSARVFTRRTPKGKYSVIVVANVADNPGRFIEGRNGFYKLRELSDLEIEQESIGLGRIRVHKIHWSQSMVDEGSFTPPVREGTKLIRQLVREVMMSHDRGERIRLA